MSTAPIDISFGFSQAVETAGSSVVSVNEGGRAGVSGTIWREGLAVTAEHTIRGLHDLRVELPNGSVSTATVVGCDPTTDVALLRLKDSVRAIADFTDPAILRVGQFVVAIGRRPTHGLIASHGIVSAISGTWRTWRGGRIDQRFRLDLVPFTGFSGGPLVNVQGKLIGINTSGPRRSIVTVPAQTVNRIVDQLLAKGRVPRGFLGLALQPVSLSGIRSSAASGGAGLGLLVVMVEQGGPADKSGLMIGDILLALEEKPLTEAVDLQSVLDPEQVGKSVHLRLLRGGEPLDVSVTIAERPE